MGCTVARGTFVHAAVLGAVGAGVLWAGQAAGVGVALALMGAVALGLVATQGPFGQLVSQLPKVQRSEGLSEAVRAAGIREDRVSVLQAQDTSFVGGWVGLPGLEHRLRESLGRIGRYRDGSILWNDGA